MRAHLFDGSRDHDALHATLGEVRLQHGLFEELTRALQDHLAAHALPVDVGESFLRREGYLQEGRSDAGMDASDGSRVTRRDATCLVICDETVETGHLTLVEPSTMKPLLSSATSVSCSHLP